MLRQIEWEEKKEPITKKAVLPLTILFLKFNFSIRTLINSWFDAPISQMPIFISFVSA